MKADILISSHCMYHLIGDVFISFLKNNMSAISIAAIFRGLKRNRSAMRLFKLSSFFTVQAVVYYISPKKNLTCL